MYRPEVICMKFKGMTWFDEDEDENGEDESDESDW
jgi:hypothetical protein